MKKDTVPVNLTHKPIYAINKYAAVDGFYKNKTDVVGISIGKAQWNSKEVIPSVKVWRHKNRWSRQSEETTMTRALDMAMLVIKTLDKHYNGKEFESVKSIYGILKVDDMTSDPTVIDGFNDYLVNNKDDINQHINILYEALKSYKGDA